MVRRTSSTRRRWSTASPRLSIVSHCSSLYGLVTRGVSKMRVTLISWPNSTSHSSIRPLIGAADEGSGVADSGMWPSPANRPEVGSRPSQPAPGT